MNSGTSIEVRLAAVVESVWKSASSLPAYRSDLARISQIQQPLVRACLPIHGAWHGAVVLEGSKDVARHAAAEMFGTESGILSAEEIHDAWGEITNIIGGNLSQFLPGPCRLSTPAVEELHWQVRAGSNGQLVAAVLFECKNGPFAVGLREHSEDHRGGCIIGG